ncbi:MAG TPA: hypothetical protein VG408_01455, partial [Actinomycetota bacterium]|nr:hypothetical protein [Actinomycetota bacterium]
ARIPQPAPEDAQQGAAAHPLPESIADLHARAEQARLAGGQPAVVLPVDRGLSTCETGLFGPGMQVGDALGKGMRGCALLGVLRGGLLYPCHGARV